MRFSEAIEMLRQSLLLKQGLADQLHALAARGDPEAETNRQRAARMDELIEQFQNAIETLREAK
jgi:hypothetical protein